MKKIKIIFILILITILAHSMWNYIEIRRLKAASKDISPLAKKTIESLYLNDSEFINNISGTDKVKTILYEKMDILKKRNYDSIELVQASPEKINIYRIVALSSYKARYSEHILKFKKINSKWMIIDFKFRDI